MDEKIIYKNFLIQKNKNEDKIPNDKNPTLIKTNSTLLLNSPYKFDIIDNIYKNKELNKFKDEILSYIRNRDNYYSEKIKNLQTQLDNNNKNIDKYSENVETRINNFLTQQIDIVTKLDKIKAYDAFMNKANDKLISHEIRINSIREDLTKYNQKYDKLYSENLEVPGYIGRMSKYPNCKIFFTEIIKEMDKCSNYREKNTIDLCTYKEKLENIIKTFQTIVENNNDSQIKYITKLNDKTSKSILDIIEEKIKNVRMDNSHFSIDLIKKSNELKLLYDKINSIKQNILIEFNHISEYYTKKLEETNKNLDDFKVEHEIIRTKFSELADFIKNGKSIRNLLGGIGKKELNLISKKLNKDLKSNIEPKNVKKLSDIDIEEIKNMDFKDKNTIDYKSNYNINNIKKKIKFSKSQNNFNKKKRIFEFSKNIGNNITNKNSANKNNEFKLNHGSIFYNTEKNLTENNSVKNFSKKRNNNLDYDKKNKIFENPKTERQIKTKAENIVKKIKKEKMNFNYKNNNTDNLIEKKLKKEKESRNNHNNINDDFSMSESCISNINNSINTFSTTNEKNNSFNSININNNKIGKFNLFESNLDNLEHNDKIIKEIASDLEQSTAKGNKLTSNKKQIEENFKLICNRIQPVNLKLNNPKKLEKIDEYGEKNNNITNKSEQNTTIFSHNINSNINSNINNNININDNSNNIGRNNKLKELVELTEKLEENDNSIKTNIIYNNSCKKNNDNEINCDNIDKRMNTYDKKLDDLESFTKEQILEVIKQISFLKKNYLILTNIIKKEKEKEKQHFNSFNLNDYNTINSINNSTHSRANIFNKGINNSNKNLFNNENKNTLNLTTNYFYKKSPTIEINPKLSLINKKAQNHDDINLSDNLFYNGKFYFNIKDILDKKKDKNNISKPFENKKLLKTIDNKALDECNQEINKFKEKFNLLK